MKSQTATEFLISYGWAILVLIISIMALSYYGVLRPEQVLTSRCFLMQGISCLEFKINNTGLMLIVSNDVFKKINDVTIITIGDKNGACNNETSNIVNELEYNEIKRFHIKCKIPPKLPSTGKGFKSELIFRYSIDDVTHEKIGEIVSQVEK